MRMHLGSRRRGNRPLPTRGRPDTPYLSYARDFARGSLAAAPNLLGVDWWEIGNATHEADWPYPSRIFRCNRGLTFFNFNITSRRPSLTFKNANASSTWLKDNNMAARLKGGRRIASLQWKITICHHLTFGHETDSHFQM